ncbi:MAG: putative lipid II flippase FtsW [Kiritimatiellales bacterium]|nr:putative lipid II flippase FtsW [Kiritimatiellota bacterium]MBL7011817.1 putative lipid II flippase FtsW [Kiritimatiellales bacterium]
MQRTITVLIAAVLILATAGLVMLFSASMVRYENSEYFVLRQLVWMIVALLAAVVCARIDFHWVRKIALPLAGLCAVALVLVRIPGIGRDINGSWRWIRLGPLTVQPSEFAKIGMILAAAWWISRRRRYMHTFKRGILVPMLGLGLFAGLLLVEPDFGTTVLTSLVIVTLLYAGGVRPAHLAGFGAVGAFGFIVLLLHNPNRMGRIFAFLDPEKYAQGEAWQLINALNAFAAGGAYGTGLGNSIQKYFYLPEAHTDFIFPIIGEELGLIATLIIILLFMVIFVCGLRIAARANDDFGRFTALGCTLMITLQALINLAVVTGSMPTKGLALPFISYGGSSLLVCASMIGLLVNVAHTARNPKAKKRTALFKDKKRKA